jgi:hypothetical protein
MLKYLTNDQRYAMRHKLKDSRWFFNQRLPYAIISHHS